MIYIKGGRVVDPVTKVDRVADVAIVGNMIVAAGPELDIEKVKAILKYMAEHNEHHTEELADMLPLLPEDARNKLTRAIGTFEAANVELRGVLDSLGE